MKQVLAAWHRIDDLIQVVERALIALGLAVIILAGMYNIALRLLGYSEIALTGVILKQFTLWLGLLGAAVATASNEHLNIDALSRTLGKRGSEFHKVVIGVICVIFSAYFTYLAYKFFGFQGKKLQSEYLGGGKFAWMWVVVFPISFGIMTLRYFFQTIEHGGVLFSPEIASADAEANTEAEVDTDSEAVEAAAVTTKDEGGEA